MKDFTSAILLDEANINRLKNRINETVILRDKSQKDLLKWKKSCSDYHGYKSPLSSYYYNVNKGCNFLDEETIEFIFRFLEIDPNFHRSGYIKERMLDLVKRIDLNALKKERIRSLLINAVQNISGREYRRYCRLLPIVKNETIISEVLKFTSNKNGSLRSRAKFMMTFANDT
jgi:hypothetical protein